MENGDSAYGESQTKTLTREDFLYGDAVTSPTKGDDSYKTVTVEEHSSSAFISPEVALDRLKEEKVALEKELKEVRGFHLAVAAEATRLEGEVVRLQLDLIAAAAAAEAAEGDANNLKKEAAALYLALQESEGQRKEAKEKFVVEKEKLVGQIDALKKQLIALEGELTETKEKLLGQIELLKKQLIALEEELTETKQQNTSLQAEIGNNRESAAFSAAQAYQDMSEVMERNVYLETEISKKTGKEDEGVVVVKEITSPPNWVSNVVATSTGAVAAVVIMSLYLRLRKQ